jgi:hypothetical protein
VLSPFQEEIARLLSALPEADGFALAGGAALIARGIVERRTGDLDFFGRESTAVDELAPALVRAAAAAGMRVIRVRDTPGFVRLELSRRTERCEVDLGYDARLWPLQQSSLGPTISDDEMAADKTLALFGRAAARDYIDVHALARRYSQEQLLELAAAKDRGFSPDHLADALGAIDRLDREQFDLNDDAYQQVRAWALDWSHTIRALESARDSVIRPQLNPPDRGPDIGL